MNKFMFDKLETIKAKGGHIINLGASGEDELRDFFKHATYKTLDLNSDNAPDIVGDAHAIPVLDQSQDAVLAFSLLEHTHSPHVVAQEIFRVLKPGGYLLLSTPFIHPYHPGRCPDYYRFSKDGLKYLFKDFSSTEVRTDGGLFYALSFFIPPQLQFADFILRPILHWLDRMFTQHRSSGHDMILFAQK